MAESRPRVLAVRLDSDGDVLLTGPAIRALRAGAAHLALLVSPHGAQAAALLPGVDEVLVFDAPWSGPDAPPVDPARLTTLVQRLRTGRYDQAVVFTSFHQSPLPAALVAKSAGIPHVSGTSEDHPGSLLEVRHRRMPHDAVDDGGPGGGHEVTAALELAAAAGFVLPPGDDGRLRLLPLPPGDGPHERYVVVHPSASVPSRAVGEDLARRSATALQQDGWHVVVTGGPGDQDLCAAVTPRGARNLAGRTSYEDLAVVLSGAEAVVVGNTGPAHLAAAVGTPVVSLFAPVVPLERWRPWGVPHVVLGDQQAACRGTRARECPVPGHPCLGVVRPGDVTDAVRQLTGTPRRGAGPRDGMPRRGAAAPPDVLSRPA